MNEFFITIVVICSTVIIFKLAQLLYKKYPTPLLLPVTVATVVIIALLVLCNISYNTFMIGGKWIDLLLGPAVVALAYPLYENRHILKELALPLLTGTFIGACIGIMTGVLFATFITEDEQLLYAIVAKSVTTPVAMDITITLGGVDTLAAVFVMIAGMSGTMLSTYVYRLFHLKTTIGRGVGIGSASHVIGTTKAMEHSLLEGSISTIAMILSALFVSILAPLFVFLLI